MPSHFQFSFGVGEYFRFNFKFGSPTPLLQEEDIRPDVRDVYLAKRNGIIIHGENGPRPQLQSDSPLFGILPTEIRHMILRMLLTTPQTIEHAHKQLGCKDSAMLDQYKAIPDIDATVLRTCRAIHTDGLQILYGLNTFSFASAQAIRHFQSYGLGAFPLAFNFRVSPTGRLQLIRNLVLELKSDYRPFSRRGDTTYIRDCIWRDWSSSLFDDRDIFGVGHWGASSTGFPRLEKLTLDFTEWQLEDADGLLVRPFVKRLKPKDGLSSLTLKGVKHEHTIEQFRDLFLAKDGSFAVINQ